MLPHFFFSVVLPPRNHILWYQSSFLSIPAPPNPTSIQCLFSMFSPLDHLLRGPHCGLALHVNDWSMQENPSSLKLHSAVRLRRVLLGPLW